MVLEHIVPSRLIERKYFYAFSLGLIYSIIGIAIASLLFPADPSLVAIAFTSILLIPSLRKLYNIEEHQAKKNKKFSLKQLWNNENDFIKAYLSILLGVFIIYALFAILLPGVKVNSLFREQIELRGNGVNIGGHAFSNSLLKSLLVNNFFVMLASIIMAFLTGDGAIYLLTWNASLWGTVFGVTARNAGIISHTNPFLLFLLILVIVLPHAFLEIMSYICGAIAGGLISNDIELDPGESRKDQFKKTYWKFILAILVFAVIFLVLGALTETFVLTNVSIYEKIIEQSFVY